MVSLSNLTQPYANPVYLVVIVVTLMPIIIGLYVGKRLTVYESIWTLLFIYLTFGGQKWHQGLTLIMYLLYQVILVFYYRHYRVKNNQTSIFVTVVGLSIVPLILVKLAPVVGLRSMSLVGFLGISYLTFKAVQVVMELRDGTIKEISIGSFIRFMTFFPTISSGPIDRFRRFQLDILKTPNRIEYTGYVAKGVYYLFLGSFYKYILGYFFGTWLLPQVAHQAMMSRGAFFGLGLSWALLGYMYVYSMYLFFDFAGYSLFAMAISYLMGVQTPRNFNAPFRAHNIKDFWNRWHMTLSFWFRDFVFMRFTFFVMRHHLIKNRIRISQAAYLVNFLIMGFWHGVTWYYIVYGIFHACAIIINDYWLRFKKRHRSQIPHNKMTEFVSVMITFNVVCFSFLIFSGFLNTLWFK